MVLATEIRALAALGRDGEVRQRVDELLAAPERRSPTPPEILRDAVLELRAHGHRAAAADVAARAIGWHDARPAAERETAAHRRSLAQALYVAERWEEARVRFATLVDADAGDLDARRQLGVIAARQGRDADARRVSAQLAEAAPRDARAASTQWRAGIAAQLGDLDAAVALLREALARGGLREGHHTDPALGPVRGRPGFRELLQPRG